jgi:hypothetical protein
MADLNALIAQGVQFQAPPNPFAQYAQMQQLQQGEQANQMNQLKMQEYQRGLQEQNALRSVVGQPGFDPMNPTHQANAFAAAPSLAPGYIEKALTTRETVAKIGKTGAETAELEYKTKLAKANKAINDISALSNPKEAIDSINAHLAAGDITPEKADALKNSLGTAPSFGAWQRSMVTGILDAKERLTTTAPKPTEMRLGDTVKTIDMNPDSPTYKQEVLPAQAINVSPDASLSAATSRRGQDITAETTRRGQNMTDAREQARILISQEDQRRAADPAFQQQMAGAKKLGEDMAKNQVVRETQLPKVLDTAAQTVSQIDALIGKRDENGNLLKGQKPHPGFANAVGVGLPLRFVPGTSESDFQTRFDQIKGGAFLQAFETLKGGGSITNVEGEKGTAALNRMNLAQSEREFVQAARDFQDVIRTGVERAKKMAGKPTAAPTGGAPAAAAPTVSNW